MTTSVHPDATPDAQLNGQAPAPAEDQLRAAHSTIGALRERLAELEETTTSQRRRVEDLTATLGTLRTEFESFKELVRDTAISYGEKHDWCEVVDHALDDMGLDPRTRDWDVTLTVSGDVRVSVAARDERDAVAQAMDRVRFSAGNSYPLEGEALYVAEIEGEATVAD